MFNQSGNTEAATEASAETGPLTMEALLGAKVTEAKLIEGGAKPKGTYLFNFAEVEERTYDIKSEDHPRVGTEALMLMLKFEIVAIDDSGKTKYLDKKKRKVSVEEMAGYVGKVHSENVMFGNDGLPDDKGEIKNPGMSKLTTILSKVIGDDNWKALKDADASVSELIEAAVGTTFMADISHNTYNDQTSDQIDMFGDFELVNPDG